MHTLLKSALRVGSLTVTVLLLGSVVAQATDNTPKYSPLEKCLQKAGDQYRSAVDTCAQKNPTNSHDFGECLSGALTHYNSKVRYCLDTYPQLGTVGGDGAKGKFKVPANKLPTMGVDGGNGNGNGNGGTGFGGAGGNTTVGGGDGPTGGTGGGFGGNVGKFNGAMEHATMATDGGGGLIQ